MSNEKRSVLTKRKAEKLLSKGDTVFYLNCGSIHKTKFVSAYSDFLRTEDGDLFYDEVGITWFLTKVVAEMKVLG